MTADDYADRIISQAAAGHLGWHEQRRLVAEAVREAVAAERERCAKTAESFGLQPEDDAPGVVRVVAEKIRAGGTVS